MTDRKHAAKLRRINRLRAHQPPRAAQHEHQHQRAVELSCGECGKHLQTMTIADAMDVVEDYALEKAIENPDKREADYAWTAISLLRDALGLPAGRSPDQRDAEVMRDLYGTCDVCGNSAWREVDEGAICNHCHPLLLPSRAHEPDTR